MREKEKTREVLLTEVKELKKEIKTLKKDKDEHLETKDKFKNIVEQINEVIFLTDEKGKIEYISPTSATIFG